jgi:hypothetical protein
LLITRQEAIFSYSFASLPLRVFALNSYGFVPAKGALGRAVGRRNAALGMAKMRGSALVNFFLNRYYPVVFGRVNA